MEKIPDRRLTIYIAPGQWDRIKQKLEEKFPLHRTINSKINQLFDEMLRS